MHFTTVRFGWFENNISTFEKYNGNGWEVLAWIAFTYILIHIICNFFMFMGADENDNNMLQKLYYPITILYMIQTIIFDLFLMCVLCSISGTYGISVGACFYPLVIAIVGGNKDDDIGVYSGIFNLARFMKQYSLHLSKYITKRKNNKLKYNEFLNIKY